LSHKSKRRPRQPLRKHKSKRIVMTLQMRSLLRQRQSSSNLRAKVRPQKRTILNKLSCAPSMRRSSITHLRSLSSDLLPKIRELLRNRRQTLLQLNHGLSYPPLDQRARFQ